LAATAAGGRLEIGWRRVQSLGAHNGKAGLTMPKLKTHKGIQKRMRLTRRGKIVRRRANAGHLMSDKSGQRRRHIRRAALVHKTQVKTYTRLMTG
jgi:large subunit ribosomal protein L35